jgi:hypothetical protein
MNGKIFVYIIDSCSIIDLFRLYPADVFPKLWEKLDKLIKKDRLISHKFVLQELSKRSDNAYRWAKNKKIMFKDITPQQIEIMKDVASKFPELIDPDKDIDADPWLIALALEREKQRKLIPRIEIKVIVTEEKFKPNKVNIPFVCQKLGIEYTNLIGLMRKEGWKW